MSPSDTATGSARARRWVITVLGLALIAPLLLVFAGFVPSERIVDGLRSASSSGTLTLTEYPPSPDGLPWTDQYTNCVALGLGIDATGASGLFSPLRGDRIGNCAELSHFLGATGTKPPDSGIPSPYSRFWHGYQVITRPMQWLGGPSLAAFAGLLTLLATLAFVAWTFWPLSRAAAIGFVLLLGAGLDIAELMSNPAHAIGLSAILATAGLAAIGARSHTSWRLPLLFTAGFIASYFSMLLNQAAWVVLIALAVTLVLPDVRTMRYWRTLASFGACWIGGYAFALVLRAAIRVFWQPIGVVWNDTVGSIALRAMGQPPTAPDRPYTGILGRSWRLLADNWNYWHYLSPRDAFVTGAAIALTTLAAVRARSWIPVARAGILLAAACVGYATFLNHAYWHPIFAWRLFPIALAAVSAIALSEIGRRNGEPGGWSGRTWRSGVRGPGNP